MFFNRYVFAVLVSCMVSFASLYLVMDRLDPSEADQLTLVLFFMSMFFSISTLFTLVGYLIRLFFYREEVFLNHFNVSLRQGIIIGMCVAVLLGLQVLQTLNWANGALIVILSFVIEVYFVARD